MAKKVLTAAVEVAQSIDDGVGNATFSWGLHDGVFAFNRGVRYLRLYGYVPGVIVRTSHGSIELEGSTGSRRLREFVTFNDTNRSSGSFPISEIISVATSGRLYDGSGQPIAGVTFSVDTVSKELVANKPFIGAAYIDYLSHYRVYKYTPLLVVSGNTINYEYGTVISFYQGQMTQYTVPVPDLTGLFEDKEIYRVYKKQHSNKYGTWEVPVGWPGSVWSHPDSPRENKAYMEYEAPLEIGYLRPTTSVGVVYHQYRVAVQRGPASPGSYTPTLYYREAAASSFIGTQWEGAYLRLDKVQMKSEVNARYPGIEDA